MVSAAWRDHFPADLHAARRPTDTLADTFVRGRPRTAVNSRRGLASGRATPANDHARPRTPVR